MNTAALLALIADLYAQIQAQQQEIERLAANQKPAPPQQ